MVAGIDAHALHRLGFGAVYPQYGRSDIAPAGHGFLQLVGHRIDQLVRRIAAQFDATGGVLPAPVLRQIQRARLGQPRIAAAHASGQFGEIGVIPKTGLVRELRQPFGVARRRLGRLAAAHAETLQIDQPRHALGTHARIHAGDVAAHAVPDQRGRPIRLEMRQQPVQITHVIGEPVTIGRPPCRQAIAAPVRRDHLPVRAQSIDQKLERGRHIHPAVQHE